MLLTITTTHRPATDLGFLLHKHPDRVQTFSTGFGEAHVFYPEASAERCTAALLLAIDPVGLVRRGRGVNSFALAEYVNDRPYVALSFLSVALVIVLKSAMAGVCKGHEELVESEIPLEAALPVVPARGGEALVRRLFEPLGYDVEATAIALDEKFPDWGDSRYVQLKLSGQRRLADLLNHLYVLLPVLDDDKHYWVDDAEIEKLMRRGEGWLAPHPDRDLIVRRYLKKQAGLYLPALATLDEAQPGVEQEAEGDAPGREEQLEETVSLRDQRLGTVQSVLRASGARRVLDLGCGPGALLQRLVRDGYEQMVGVDVSVRALEIAARRLRLDEMHDAQRERIMLLQSPDGGLQSLRIDLPDPSLIVLIGPSGCGKSSFARAHFVPTEVISSDFCRGLVADDENDQAATSDAFAVLQFIAGRRLAQPRFTVVDATNVQREARRPLIELAKQHDLLPVAIVLDMPEAICQERNRARPDRDFGPHVVRNQRSQLHKSLRGLQREGFRRVWVLRSPEEVETAEIERRPLWTDRRSEHCPFDVIGDIHGCYAELTELLRELGYEVGADGVTVTPPDGRRAIFVGDYGDRGPDTPAVLRLVMSMAEAGTAICLPGNHDIKLVRKLKGRDVQITHGLAETLEQLESESDEFRDQARDFLDKLVSHVVLDDGKLVVAHAGMKQAYQGRSSGRVRDFALFGETTGETDEFGLPIRLQWASEYRGAAAVVYGHTPVAEPEWLNDTINIDTGCVFGGRLTALRWPERELVSVPASRTYYEPAKPFLPPEDAAPAVDEDRPPFLPDVEDVSGKRIIQTALARNVTVREDEAAAAIEVMSRFAIDPRWLVYLPPTMAPTSTSNRPDVLEYPEEAFSEYRANGVPHVICEEKHMGSRAIVIVCRDPDVAKARFGMDSDEPGVIYSRTGRAFLSDPSDSAEALGRVRVACDATGLWDALSTDWVLLDCELMPWSAKAIELIRRQYAAVGAAAHAGLDASISALEHAQSRGLDVADLLESQRRRNQHIDHYVDAYRRYVWPVNTVSDLRLAPFHILAAETGVFIDRGHDWHLQLCDQLVDADPEWFTKTGRLVVDVTDPDSQAAGIAWWEKLTNAGGEGMVVKPSTFTARGRKGLVQPGIKCRGREYLRIIYGPEYADPSQIERLRSRSLGRNDRLQSANSPWALKRSKDSCDESLSTGCTNASSGYSRWKASQSTPDSEP